MEQAHMNLQSEELKTRYYIIISFDGRQMREQARINLQLGELKTRYYISISLNGRQVME